MSMQREDDLPWFKQFWPWFIIALPASAVVAGLYTVWLSLQTGDSLVIRGDDGINVATERLIAAEHQASQLGILANVGIDPNTGVVVVALQADAIQDFPATLDLYMRHPTMAARDAAATLHRAMDNESGQPVWTGHFTTPPSGRMIMTLSALDAWQISAEWSGDATTILGASNAIQDAGS